MSKLKTKLLIIMMRAIRRIQIEGITAKGHSKTEQDAACGYSAIFILIRGTKKTTTAQIARAAGMSPTSFFAAFENKGSVASDADTDHV